METMTRARYGATFFNSQTTLSETFTALPAREVVQWMVLIEEVSDRPHCSTMRAVLAHFTGSEREAVLSIILDEAASDWRRAKEEYDAGRTTYLSSKLAYAESIGRQMEWMDADRAIADFEPMARGIVR